MKNTFKSAYQLADKNIKTLIDVAGLERTNVFIVSDHGMAPFHTVIEINQILRDNGFVLTCPGVQVRAITSGGQAHIYVNLRGRSPGAPCLVSCRV